MRWRGLRRPELRSQHRPPVWVMGSNPPWATVEVEGWAGRQSGHLVGEKERLEVKKKVEKEEEEGWEKSEAEEEVAAGPPPPPDQGCPMWQASLAP